MSGWQVPVRDALRAGPGVDLAALDPRATPGWSGGKDDARRRVARVAPELSELQERLFAHGRSGGDRAVLLVLQGMDTSGKGGIVRHVVGLVDPQGVAHRSFGVPTEEERSHHWLWRVRRALPAAGQIGVFDRSHYEDVLVVRVHDLAPPAVWGARYDEIRDFEAEVLARGTALLKVALVISPGEQRERLLERLDRPDKHWKLNPRDIDERAHWPAYTEAYQAVLDRTSTPDAPWYVVPADRKWYARLAVTELLTATLRDLGLGWPETDVDVVAERERLLAQPW